MSQNKNRANSIFPSRLSTYLSNVAQSKTSVRKHSLYVPSKSPLSLFEVQQSKPLQTPCNKNYMNITSPKMLSSRYLTNTEASMNDGHTEP